MGRFITPIVGSDMLSDVQAGFIPALPLIPMTVILQVVSFFRYYMRNGVEQEALVNIYWDKLGQNFIVDTPKQYVSKASVRSRINEIYSGERFIHYMDIHSHNSMKAFFSETDDADEKATRLYSVIGQLDKYFPSIETRISNGGKFWPIDPVLVFERMRTSFPEEWTDNVCFRSPHGSENVIALWDLAEDSIHEILS